MRAPILTFALLVDGIRRRHAIREAEHRLASLDAHLLRDIGLDRLAIPGAVRDGRPIR